MKNDINENKALSQTSVSGSTFCCGIFPTNDCTDCGYYKSKLITNKNGKRIIRGISEVHLAELENQDFKNRNKMKLEDLKNKKTVMIKPQGLINHREMEVTLTKTGFTISNYGNSKIAGHEYLFVVNSQEDLDSLDILR